ncbi:MAG: Zn-dependent hydrolase of the beta-lactamase fold-like protein [Candidatus Woesebacteria bacterium GW2011_GWA1_45_8]|uniref:Zn-dependent hydrolase of the beta-lactamase fold-like protein n=1 Tax=Candidatus Woesebacteria bacterium GW2011_GWA1_45_8 TaxID=1618559 RepID=A0A0G1MV26_9BACT|nr:MAG: Zn-dependent hydrolase of the beta-lactamase fold-like protein [Candidatus Woesebacteria bacterium GW2011_GWA1_45_8]
MEISYLGHSSFRIKTSAGFVVTDPYDPKMVGLKFSGVEADIVTVSHDHADHNQYQLVKGVKRVVMGPGEYEIAGISIIGIPTFHDDKKGELRGKNTIYIIEAEGLRLAHLGDLGHLLSEAEVEEIGQVDILILPVGGEFTIGPKEATQVVMDIEPRVIIPMHYKTPGLNPDVFSKLVPVEEFLKEVSLTTERLPKFSVKKEELGEEQKVIVLEAK